ncbi:hypothetical protein AB0G32_12320 [Streptomyces sp. NPDC023723]|uniref:wHTH domain-containing protein n=1 Tax=Streptomyces sp. NPDC023723 TaxID=3154323 RepID=UPI0033C7979F
MANIPVPDDHQTRVMVSRELNGRDPWLDPAEPVTALHVARAAAHHLGGTADVAERLAGLGYRLPPAEELAAITDADVRLLSRDLDGRGPWITPEDIPGLRVHVLRAALRLDRRPAELAARCAEFGFPVPGPDRFPQTVDHDDLKLVSGSLDGQRPALPDDPPRLRAHLVRAAAEFGRPAAELAARCAELGYRPPAPGTLPEAVEDGDQHLVRDASGALLSDTEPVPLGHVLHVLHLVRPRDLPRTPAETADAVIALGERFTRLGFRTSAAVPEVSADDLVLASAGLDGRAPWLDAGQPVPLHHVLRFAHTHGRDPNEVVARLGRLGHHHLPEGPLAGSVDAADLDLTERDRGGRFGRLTQRDPEWLPHLLAVCVRTGRTPAEAADRLRRLGYRIPAEGIPAEARERDLRLLSLPVPTEDTLWISRTGPVPVGYALRAAHAEGMTAAAVADRLRELGHRVPDLPDRPVTEDDLRLITEQRDGTAVPLADTVPYGRIVQAAEEAGGGVREAAERYRALGYTDVVLPADPPAGPIGAGATGLVRSGTGWLDPRAVVAPAHILRRADADGTGPAEIGRRLRALGYRRLSDTLPPTTRPDDLKLITFNGHGVKFLDPAEPVSANHVRHIAYALKRSSYDVAVRLAALGHTLGFAPEPDDALILSQNVDGSAPWVQLMEDAGLGHVLRAAQLLGRTPAEIDERLRAFGDIQHTLPAFDGYDDVDILVLSRNLDARAPWLGWLGRPTLEHVLRAARATGHTPEAIARRLTRLGHEIHVPATADPAELPLVRALPPADGPLRTEDLLTVVGELGLSPAELARRLTALGVAIPDVTYPDRRPAPAP